MPVSRFWSVALLGLLCLISVRPGLTYGQSSVCDRALDAAEDQYLESEYDEALRLVASCLDQGDKTASQAVSAYRRLALIHLKQDKIDRARTAVVNLLGIDPTYTADPVTDPPAYVSLVSVVQKDLQSTRTAEAPADSTRTSFFRRTSTWVTMGSVLLGGGVAAVFAFGDRGGGGGDPPSGTAPLPTPPTAP